MKEFLSYEDIPLHSTWMAADGTSHGKIVVDKMDRNKDIVIRDFVVQEGKKVFKEDLRRIDWFKLQYRYFLVRPDEKYV